jgi:hypothetical protein
VKNGTRQGTGQFGGLFGFEPDKSPDSSENNRPGNLTPRVFDKPRRGFQTQAGPRAKDEPETRSDRITAEFERLITAEALARGENVAADGWKIAAFDRAFNEGRLLPLAIKAAGGLSYRAAAERVEESR